MSAMDPVVRKKLLAARVEKLAVVQAVGARAPRFIDPVARKRLLAARVEELGTAQTCDCCLEAAAMQAEEFFNKCHEQGGEDGGRFCETSGDKKSSDTPKHGVVDKRVDYIKQRVGTAVNTHKGRRESDSVERVTTGAARRALGLSTAYGSVKLNKLADTKINMFSDKDLGVLRGQLISDQSRYNKLQMSGWFAVAKTATKVGVKVVTKSVSPANIYLPSQIAAIGLARWKTKRIKGQIQRFERELSKRGQTFEAQTIDLTILEFAEDDGDLLTLAQEMAQAKKDVEAGNGPKNPKVSAEDLDELGKMIDALEVDPEEGITSGMIKDLKKMLALLTADSKQK